MGDFWEILYKGGSGTNNERTANAITNNLFIWSFPNFQFAFVVRSLLVRSHIPTSRRNVRETSAHVFLSFLEFDAFDLFLRAAYNGRFAKHAGLHLAVRSEDTGEVQCTGDVSYKTEVARHSGSCQGMRVGGFPS